MSIIKCENLSLGYNGKTVVENLNFSVNKGDYICILGENGSGKSTLIKAILGLIKPMSGTLAFSDDKRLSHIGYLPQQTEVQRDFPVSVFEIVLSGRLIHRGLHPFYAKNDKIIAKRNMEKLGISNLLKASYRELSGGQQQRVLLARALCAAEDLLLLDEPVSGLDSNVTADMYNIIEALNKAGITVIMITHDLAAAKKYATHILHVGSTAFFGTKAEYFESRS